MQLTATLAGIVLVCLGFTVCVASGMNTGALQTQAVHDLTDDTFEHVTQACSGATTGDWFIMFHAKFCPHCRVVIPELDKLVQKYDIHATNIAKVDCKVGSWSCHRFSVRSYPTFVYVSKGKMVVYQGERTSDAISNFLVSAPLSKIEGNGSPVPPPTSTYGKVVHFLGELGEGLQAAWDEYPQQVVGLLLGSFTLTLLFMHFVYPGPPKPIIIYQNAPAGELATESKKDQ